MRGNFPRRRGVLRPAAVLVAGQPQRHSGFPAAVPIGGGRRAVGQPRYLGWHTLITLSEILSGLALGVLLGVVLALCMMISPRLQRWLMPLVLTSQAIPVFALAPLLVLWFGFGMSAKVMMAVLVIFFP
jgi:ABC-type nitrate/sulfonate/bicarbonate transport system permease component